MTPWTALAMSKEYVIAFDLSLSNTGYAVGELSGNTVKVVRYGSIGTRRYASRSQGMRLSYILDELSHLLYEYGDQVKKLVKERSFSNGRIQASQIIQKVNGVFEVVAYIAGLDDWEEYAPTSVKKLVTGDGRASKEQVAQAVTEATGITTKINDESDAIAVLMAHCAKAGYTVLKEV